MRFAVTRENFDRLKALCDSCDNNIVNLVARWGREVCRAEKKHDREECRDCDVGNWMEELSSCHDQKMARNESKHY